LKILIAEDNDKMRQMIKKTLTDNFNTIEEIYECENGEDAINIYNQYTPDWILLDIKMEPVDGLSAARSIKAKDPRAKIILVTNFDEEEYREEANKISVTAYVLKENLFELTRLLQKN
jgi:YesN/AraC family two-component response regulator